MGSGSFDEFTRPSGSSMPHTVPFALVFLQAATGKIAAHDALDREHLGLAHEHEAAAQVVGVGLELLGQVGHVGRDQVVFDHAVEQLEPEARDLREHRAFVGNLVLKNVVERRNAVGCDEQQLVAQIVQVAHLALRVGLDVDTAHVQPFTQKHVEPAYYRRKPRVAPSQQRSAMNPDVFVKNHIGSPSGDAAVNASVEGHLLATEANTPVWPSSLRRRCPPQLRAFWAVRATGHAPSFLRRCSRSS